MTARVLVVCTANICRSPAAAGLLAARLGPSVEVVSAGTKAFAGGAMCGVSANWLMMNGGGSGEAHTSRRLELADIRAATLILTASRRHRSAVIELRPAAQVRTYTLAQAARIASWRRAQGAAPPSQDPAEQVLWLTEQLDTHRGAAPPGPDGADDIRDPHQGAPHADVLPQLITAVDTVSAAMGR